MKRLSFLCMALVLTMAACGCGSSVSSGVSGDLPAGDPDIRGSIESITGDARDFSDPDEVIGSIFVEAAPGEESAFDSASVSIDGRTRIFTKAPGGEPVPVDTLALGIGRQVEVWFTGPVAESYPVQALADVIYVIDKGGSVGDIFQVKDMYVAELMGIGGVVGVGIGGTAGDMHIVVYLENGSAALKERIPSELDGFEVVTEVTGSITPQ